MAYNNVFPIGYQPAQLYYPQPQIQQPIQPAPVQTQSISTPTMPTNSTPSSSIIWVQGEAGAKSYLVAPNTTVQLWDSERQSIYLKSADGSGMPSMKTLDYVIREDQNQQIQNIAETPAANTDYITKEDFEELKKDLKRDVKKQVEFLIRKESDSNDE